MQGVKGTKEQTKTFTFRLERELTDWVMSLDENYSDYFRRLIREDYEKYHPVKRGPGRPKKMPRTKPIVKPIEPLDLFPLDD